MAGNEPTPPWFQSFLDSDRTAKIETAALATERFNVLHGLSEKKIKDDAARDKLAALTDDAEVMVRGLPRNFTGSLYDAARFILAALGFGRGHDIPNIIETREWQPTPRPDGSENNANTASSNIHRPLDTAPYSITFSFYVSSPSIRDRIIRASGRLRQLTANQIFGCGGQSPVYLRPVYPKPVFDLLSKTRTVCHTLGYATPVVRNLRVFARQTFQSDLLPILTEDDLLHLPSIQQRRSQSPLQYQTPPSITAPSITEKLPPACRQLQQQSLSFPNQPLQQRRQNSRRASSNRNNLPHNLNQRLFQTQPSQPPPHQQQQQPIREHIPPPLIQYQPQHQHYSQLHQLQPEPQQSQHLQQQFQQQPRFPMQQQYNPQAHFPPQRPVHTQTHINTNSGNTLSQAVPTGQPQPSFSPVSLIQQIPSSQSGNEATSEPYSIPDAETPASAPQHQQTAMVTDGTTDGATNDTVTAPQPHQAVRT